MKGVNLEKFSRLDEGTQSLIKYQYRMIGDFFKCLWEAIYRADEVNLEKLALGFPLHVQALKNFRHKSGWWTEVRKSVNIYPD